MQWIQLLKSVKYWLIKFDYIIIQLKSKLLCYNVANPDIVYVTLGNTTVRTSLHEKNLGNFISN